MSKGRNGKTESTEQVVEKRNGRKTLGLVGQVGKPSDLLGTSLELYNAVSEGRVEVKEANCLVAIHRVVLQHINTAMRSNKIAQQNPPKPILELPTA